MASFPTFSFAAAGAPKPSPAGGAPLAQYLSSDSEGEARGRGSSSSSRRQLAIKDSERPSRKEKKHKKSHKHDKDRPSSRRDRSRRRKEDRDHREHRVARVDARNGGSSAHHSSPSSLARHDAASSRRDHDERERAKEHAFLAECAKLFSIDRHRDLANLCATGLSPYQTPRYRRSTRRVLGLPGTVFVENWDGKPTSKGLSLIVPGLRPATKDPPLRFFAKGVLPKETTLLRPVTAAEAASGQRALKSDFIAFRASDSEPESDDNGDPADPARDRLAVELDAHRERVKEFNQRLHHDPHNVALWREFIDFQRTEYRQPAQLADRQLALYERALDANPDAPDLRRAYLQCGARVWPSDRVSDEYRNAVLRFPHHAPLVLDALAQGQGQRTVSDSLAAYARVIDALTPVTVAPDGPPTDEAVQADTVRVQVWLRTVRLLLEAGFTERAVALVQAQAEATYFAPNSAPARWDRLLDQLADFWDAELPRVGDPGAKGWARAEWQQAPLVVTEIPLPPNSSHEMSDPLVQWLADEADQASRDGVPLRSTDPVFDLDGVVLFGDVAPYLINVQTAAGRRLLLIAILNTLGCDVAELPFAADDPMLAVRERAAADLELMFDGTRPNVAGAVVHLDDDEEDAADDVRGFCTVDELRWSSWTLPVHRRNAGPQVVSFTDRILSELVPVDPAAVVPALLAFRRAHAVDGPVPAGHAHARTLFGSTSTDDLVHTANEHGSATPLLAVAAIESLWLAGDIDRALDLYRHVASAGEPLESRAAAVAHVQLPAHPTRLDLATALAPLTLLALHRVLTGRAATASPEWLLAAGGGLAASHLLGRAALLDLARIHALHLFVTPARRLLDLRAAASAAVAAAPGSQRAWRLLAHAEHRTRMHGRFDAARRQLGDSSLAAAWTAVEFELARGRTHGGGGGGGYSVGRLRALLGQATGAGASAAVAWWQVWLRVECAALAATPPKQKRAVAAAANRVRTVALRAVAACPWARAVYVAAVKAAVEVACPVIPVHEAVALVTAMGERGVRVRAAVDLGDDEEEAAAEAVGGLVPGALVPRYKTVAADELEAEVDAVMAEL
ncbi:hypothetical protein H9P43_008220 [Blastocladiella emersonii ATCC 22665]|nr:hypothetical protein H9P43_008220 [Blastocladiella emersonii ATCC 22665]